MKGHFALYYVDNSFFSIDNEMNIGIMETLKSGDLPINKIAEKLGKTPSTTALHLKELNDDGLLFSTTSDKDNRSTIYGYTNCELIAVKKPPENEENDLENTLTHLVNNEIPLTKAIFKMFFQQLKNLWVDAIPSTNPISKTIGKLIVDKVGKDDLFSVLTELKDFFEEMDIGLMTFSVSDTIQIIVSGTSINDDMDSYFIEEFVTSVSKSAMECSSGRRMKNDRNSWSDNELTLIFSFER